MDYRRFDLISRILFPTPEATYTADDFPEELIWVPKDLSRDTTNPEKCVPCLFLMSPSARFVILYFHSNAEDLGRCYAFCSFLRFQFQVHVLAVEYPGYGICPGGPANEDSVNENARVAFRFLREVLGWPLDGILVLGRSIGCGPALTIAVENCIYGVVLVCPFLSVRELCKDMVGMFANLVAERFPNKDRVPLIKSPLLLVHGKKDTVVPVSHGERLYESCRTRKRLVCPDHMEHNTNLHTDVSYFVLPMLQFFSLPDYAFEEFRVPRWLFDKRRALINEGPRLDGFGNVSAEQTAAGEERSEITRPLGSSHGVVGLGPELQLGLPGANVPGLRLNGHRPGLWSDADGVNQDGAAGLPGDYNFYPKVRPPLFAPKQPDSGDMSPRWSGPSISPHHTEILNSFSQARRSISAMPAVMREEPAKTARAQDNATLLAERAKLRLREVAAAQRLQPTVSAKEVGITVPRSHQVQFPPEMTAPRARPAAPQQPLPNGDGPAQAPKGTPSPPPLVEGGPQSPGPRLGARIISSGSVRGTSAAAIAAATASAAGGAAAPAPALHPTSFALSEGAGGHRPLSRVSAMSMPQLEMEGPSGPIGLGSTGTGTGSEALPGPRGPRPPVPLNQAAVAVAAQAAAAAADAAAGVAVAAAAVAAAVVPPERQQSSQTSVGAGSANSSGAAAPPSPLAAAGSAADAPTSVAGGAAVVSPGGTSAALRTSMPWEWSLSPIGGMEARRVPQPRDEARTDTVRHGHYSLPVPLGQVAPAPSGPMVAIPNGPPVEVPAPMGSPRGLPPPWDALPPATVAPMSPALYPSRAISPPAEDEASPGVAECKFQVIVEEEATLGVVESTFQMIVEEEPALGVVENKSPATVAEISVVSLGETKEEAKRGAIENKSPETDEPSVVSLGEVKEEVTLGDVDSKSPDATEPSTVSLGELQAKLGVMESKGPVAVESSVVSLGEVKEEVTLGTVEGKGPMVLEGIESLNIVPSPSKEKREVDNSEIPGLVIPASNGKRFLKELSAELSESHRNVQEVQTSSLDSGTEEDDDEPSPIATDEDEPIYMKVPRTAHTGPSFGPNPGLIVNTRVTGGGASTGGGGAAASPLHRPQRPMLPSSPGSPPLQGGRWNHASADVLDGSSWQQACIGTCLPQQVQPVGFVPPGQQLVGNDGLAHWPWPGPQPEPACPSLARDGEALTPTAGM